jgi:TonB family protein
MSLGVKSVRAWDEWQGQVVGSNFRLLRYLGGGERSAVFLTERPHGEPKTAAIKLVLVSDIAADAQLARWKASALLSHSHLVRLFEMGRDQLGGTSFAYVLMEYAEEDLSQVDRPITAVEAADMLESTLSVLDYLHGKRLAHGHLKSSNIMAVSDQLRLSSDTIRSSGEWIIDLDLGQPGDPPEIVKEGASPAGDVWSLGITLVEATTKHLPSWDTGLGAPSLPNGLPELFRVPVLNCLRRDPRVRWTVADFTTFLQRNVETSSPSGHESPATKGMKYRYLVAAGAVGLTLAAAALVIPRLTTKPATPMAPVIEPVGLRREPVTSQRPAEDSPPKEIVRESGRNVLVGEIVKEVLPDVPAKARGTIRGKVTINIRVSVNDAGSVVDVKNESPESSQFFGHLALQAARQWKFIPANSGQSAQSREWTLRFQFVRDAKRPVSVQAISAH